MAIIKKGAYKWNKELTDLGYTTEISIPFTVPPHVEIDNASVDYINSRITNENLDYPLLEYGVITSFVCNSIRFYKNDGSDGYYIVEYGIESCTYSSDNPVLNLIFGESREKIPEVYHSGSGPVVGGFSDGYLQYFTVLEDTIVEDEAFATWFNENAKPYTETPTVDSIKSKLQALINKANEATGKSDVNLDNAVSNLVAGYGTGGGGDIIEVTELPTENINEDALYKMGDSYYKYGELVFDDVIMTQEDSTQISYKEAATRYGMTFSCNIIPTKTTENIKVSVSGDSPSETAFHLYYIEDENDIFMYGDMANTGTTDWMSMSEESNLSFNGIISDASEITEQGNYCYAVMITQWKQYVNGEVIIEVDELPTENIDESVFYKYNDSLYQYKCEFIDIIVLTDDGPISLVLFFTALGFGTFKLYYEKTRPTENIVVSSITDSGVLFACYYIGDEDDILVYGDFEETGMNTWVSFATVLGGGENGGMISDTSQATDPSLLYALGEKGWKSYIVPVGNIIITENSTVDVKDKESATVKIPTAYSYQTIAELPADALNGSIAIVFGGE